MKLPKPILFIALAIIATLAALFMYVSAGFRRPILASQPTFFTVRPGASLSKVAAELEEKGIIPSAFLLRLLARLENAGPVQAADYQFLPGISLKELYYDLVEGKSLSPERQVTLVEGWTLEQIADALEQAGIIADKAAFLQAATENTARFVAKFDFLKDKPAEASLEGYLFPDTYRFFPASEPDVVIEKLLGNFGSKLGDDVRAAIRTSGRNIHEAITLASIIEKEVRTPQEMKTVAGIFKNRLDIGMALQADSTVNYLTKSGRDRSTFEDLAIDSPYNTYKYAGLPPGPISNPGLNAIMAAAAPAETTYFYFLTDSEGRVYYAKTLEEHNENRRKYL